MASLHCALLCDGPSDVALCPILQWTLKQYRPRDLVECEWADLRRLPKPPKNLADRIYRAVDLYECHVLFVHRDAEAQSPDARYEEIKDAVLASRKSVGDVPYICVVPVRMQEAWLLLDESAIRHAAGNPNGDASITLPPPTRIEDLPDPKAELRGLLRLASGLRGRRLKKFNESHSATRVTTYMNDFSALRVLPSFQRLELDVKVMAAKLKV